MTREKMVTREKDYEQSECGEKKAGVKRPETNETSTRVRVCVLGSAMQGRCFRWLVKRSFAKTLNASLRLSVYSMYIYICVFVCVSVYAVSHEWAINLDELAAYLALHVDHDIAIYCRLLLPSSTRELFKV